MAKLSEVMAIIADCIGWQENAVKQYGRHAREGGFISQGARGNAAPEATPSDVANLVISILASDYAKDAPRIIPLYRGLQPVGVQVFDALPELFGTMKSRLFGDYLDALISGSELGTLKRIIDDLMPNYVDGQELVHRRTIQVRIQSYPFKRATIVLAGIGCTFHEDKNNVFNGKHDIDLKVTREITNQTIFKLGEAMRR